MYKSRVLSLKWERIDGPWTNGYDHRYEREWCCDADKRFSLAGYEIDRYTHEPEPEYDHEVAIHRDIVLSDTQGDRIRKHEYLWDDGVGEVTAEYRDEPILSLVWQWEYIGEVPESRESYDHPSDHPLWPVREIQKDFRAVGVEYEKVNIDEWDSDKTDEEWEEFIYFKSSLLYIQDIRKLWEPIEWCDEWECDDCPVPEELIFINVRIEIE